VPQEIDARRAVAMHVPLTHRATCTLRSPNSPRWPRITKTRLCVRAAPECASTNARLLCRSPCHASPQRQCCRVRVLFIIPVCKYVYKPVFKWIWPDDQFLIMSANEYFWRNLVLNTLLLLVSHERLQSNRLEWQVTTLSSNGHLRSSRETCFS
jgi:hypothetical protein